MLEADPTNEYVTLLPARTLERQSRHAEASLLRRRLAGLGGIDEHSSGHRLAG